MTACEIEAIHADWHSPPRRCIRIDGRVREVPLGLPGLIGDFVCVLTRAEMERMLELLREAQWEAGLRRLIESE